MEPAPLDHDVVLLLEACSAAFSDRLLAEVRAAVGGDVRVADGYVFQHVMGDGIRVTELAERLGVTQQAASKQVADLEARGLIEREADPGDRRASRITLSRRGQAAVDAARAARRQMNEELEELLGPRKAAALRRHLVDVADSAGAIDRMAARRLRPEAAR
jgi:DNA-binding MarR family transcriptional regulator